MSSESKKFRQVSPLFESHSLPLCIYSLEAVASSIGLLSVRDDCAAPIRRLLIAVRSKDSSKELCEVFTAVRENIPPDRFGRDPLRPFGGDSVPLLESERGEAGGLESIAVKKSSPLKQDLIYASFELFSAAS